MERYCEICGAEYNKKGKAMTCSSDSCRKAYKKISRKKYKESHAEQIKEYAADYYLKHKDERVISEESKEKNRKNNRNLYWIRKGKTPPE